MKNSKQIFQLASSTRRLGAFLLDVFFVYILRIITAQILIKSWLFNSFLFFRTEFLLMFKVEFGSSQLTEVQKYFLLNHEFFRNFIIFLFLVFFIGFFYDFFCFISKFSGSLGQRILKLHVVTKESKKLDKITGLRRAVFVSMPFLILFLMFLYESMALSGFATLIDKNLFIVVVILIPLIWYDTYLFTNDKLILHDIFSKTRVVSLFKATGKVEQKMNFLQTLIKNPVQLIKFDYLTKIKNSYLNFVKKNIKKTKKK